MRKDFSKFMKVPAALAGVAALGSAAFLSLAGGNSVRLLSADSDGTVSRIVPLDEMKLKADGRAQESAPGLGNVMRSASGGGKPHGLSNIR
ncbi:MAG: hypothetical protein K2I45_02155 [Muribaculaceae bacterium]|nr:hypothetical protein [Muribaculaceae bacterium]